jgi:uncharacterized zinc-type alcohol dehydrogenase-like protein
MKVRGYAANAPKASLAPFEFERRVPREKDVVIEILYCGVCHSDIHQARDEWGGSIFPIVPGHEIVGKVIGTGTQVTKFKIGDSVGVGCLVDSCRTCTSCQVNLEQYCENGFVGTYNSIERDGKTPTFGGYSSHIVVDEAFVLSIPANLELAKTAPLLCAGITTYSPLRYWKVGSGMKVGVIGLGGLGHMAVKLAAAMGAHVVLFTTSESKIQDGLKFGAKEVVLSSNQEDMKKHVMTLDLIINTVAAKIALTSYLNLLKREGTMVMLGVSPDVLNLEAHALIMQRKNLAGSLIGGLKETQEMLNFCSKHNITSDIELIPIQKINEAYERTVKSQVKYRFVIDMKSL